MPVNHTRIKSTTNLIFRMRMVHKKLIYHSFLIFWGETLSIHVPAISHPGFLPSPSMKRAISGGDPEHAASGSGEKDSKKKIKQNGEEDMSKEAEAVLLDENLLYEVLRRVDDGPTLAKAACVGRQWRRTAHDERIWELICTRHYHRSPTQLRAVVSALGGFRRLYSSHLWPLLKPASSSSSSAPAAASAWPCLPPSPAPPPAAARSKARWGKDEMNFSLSLLSIKYFEKMSFNHRSK